ncbi:MAG TPA: MFS transporter [Candidatus Hydrogenedentes bacterium]|nr:MFS transporter [Candidatus Hydrogenedentota bacterium]
MFHPQREIPEPALQRGLRLLVYEVVFAQVMGILTTGGFLIGFAVLLGAGNTMIGLVSALGPLAMTLQAPAVFLVERTRRRKLVLVLGVTVSRSMWFLIPIAALLLPPRQALISLLVMLTVHYGLINVATCAFNSWMRDLIPEEEINRVFTRRLTWATLAGALVSLAAALGIDAWSHWLGGWGGGVLTAYTIVFLVAACAGVLSTALIAMVPEPEMRNGETGSVLRALLRPFRDGNFRQLLIFLGWWQFAVNLAAPFFAVYMIRRLELGMGWVIGAATLSQLVNVLFYPVWGRLADRFSNKSVLLVSAPLFVFSFLLWPFTTLPEKHVLTIPILLCIHVLAGIGTAGVNLCVNNLSLKLAPPGHGGSYLAGAALISGIVATFAPILAGIASDVLEDRVISLVVRYVDVTVAAAARELPALDLRGLDYVFLAAFLLGLYAMHRLLSVREQGETDERVVRTAAMGEILQLARQVSTAAGVRHILSFVTLFPLLRAKAIRDRDMDLSAHKEVPLTKVSIHESSGTSD